MKRVPGPVSDQEQYRLGRELRWLCPLLIFAAFTALAAHAHLPSEGWRGSEYGMPAEEFQQTRRISSVFLPVGYSGMVGFGRILFHGDAGLFAANFLIFLLWIVSVWIALRMLGVGRRRSFVAGMFFAVYPDVLLTINKAAHITITSVLILAFVSAAVWMVHSRENYHADLLLGFVLGFAMLTRPNLLLLFPVTWFLIWKYKLRHALLRAVGGCAVSFVLYAAFTTAVHGSLYWPQMGSYNLFAGANEFTRQDVERSYDNAAEGSIIPALGLRGIQAYHDWSRPDNIPGDNEVRNPRFTGLYTREAIRFILHHPRTMAELTWLKLITLFRPDLQIHPLRSIAGMLKVIAACSFWIWVALSVFKRPPNETATLIIALTAGAFILPHLITVSAPRYRIPLDVLSIVGIVALLDSPARFTRIRLNRAVP